MTQRRQANSRIRHLEALGAGFAVVGAPSLNAAFVYRTSPPSDSVFATLSGPDARDGDGFGKAVSLSQSGTWIAVGAPYRLGAECEFTVAGRRYNICLTFEESACQVEEVRGGAGRR